MNFLRSRSEQLAEHLRRDLLAGRVNEPLASTRNWSQQLGVSRNTLDQALLQLKRERLILVSPRGIRLNRDRIAVRGRTSTGSRSVRILYFGRHMPDEDCYFWYNWVAPLSESLQQYDIHLTMERCSAARFEAIARQRDQGNTLYFLFSLPEKYQRLLTESANPCFILAEPAPGLTTPFLKIDQGGAIRHATHWLLRHGHSIVNLVIRNVRAPGMAVSLNAFHSACRDWPRQPIQGQEVLFDPSLERLLFEAHNYAASVKQRRGIIVVHPVPVGLIMTSLLAHEITIPEQAEVVGVMTSPESVRVWPPLVHYPYPANRVAKILTNVTLHYFETGVVPPIRKTITAELVPAFPA